MSRHQFRGGMGRTMAELDIDTSRLHGTGGVDYPSLAWQLQLVLLPQQAPHKDYAYKTVEAQLFLSPGPKIADARPIVLHRIMRGHQAYQGEEYLSFEFPLDTRRIETLERYRQSGPLKLRLHVQLGVEEYGVIEAHAESKRPPLWGLCSVYRLDLQEEIQIAQTDWAERVLPGLGYGKVIVVEFPAAPLDSCEGLSHSLKALKQAEEKHRLGFYDDAVGKCRMALERFFDHEPVDPSRPDSRRIPALKKSWEAKLGKATYAWLDNALGALKDASNRPHHSPNTHYGQADSQMILAIATAVVAYVARSVDLQGEDDKQAPVPKV